MEFLFSTSSWQEEEKKDQVDEEGGGKRKKEEGGRKRKMKEKGESAKEEERKRRKKTERKNEKQEKREAVCGDKCMRTYCKGSTKVRLGFLGRVCRVSQLSLVWSNRKCLLRFPPVTKTFILT